MFCLEKHRTTMVPRRLDELHNNELAYLLFYSNKSLPQPACTVFWNRACLPLFVYKHTNKHTNKYTNNFKLYCLYFFFRNLSFQIGGAAYLRVRLIHGTLR